MTNLQKLESKISNAGWYSSTLILHVTLECAFEGWSGRATETWEPRVTIELNSPDEAILPNIKFTGKSYQNIDEIAGIVLQQIELWQKDKQKQKIIEVMNLDKETGLYDS